MRWRWATPTSGHGDVEPLRLERMGCTPGQWLHRPPPPWQEHEAIGFDALDASCASASTTPRARSGSIGSPRGDRDQVEVACYRAPLDCGDGELPARAAIRHADAVRRPAARRERALHAPDRVVHPRALPARGRPARARGGGLLRPWRRPGRPWSRRSSTATTGGSRGSTRSAPTAGRRSGATAGSRIRHEALRGPRGRAAPAPGVRLTTGSQTPARPASGRIEHKRCAQGV